MSNNYKKYIPSSVIKKRIADMEGNAMNGTTIDPLSKKYAPKNNSFEEEARLFYSKLPEDIRDKILSNQTLADNLYSYSYNVGSGNFAKRVVPALEAYYNGTGNAQSILDSMYGGGDSKLNGLSSRRKIEKQEVLKSLPIIFLKPQMDIIAQPDATRVARPVVPMQIHRKDYGGYMSLMDMANQHLYGDGGLSEAYDNFYNSKLGNYLGYVPWVGSAIEIGNLINHPSWENLGWTAASVASDLVGGRLATKLAKNAAKSTIRKGVMNGGKVISRTPRGTILVQSTKNAAKEDAAFSKIMTHGILAQDQTIQNSINDDRRKHKKADGGYLSLPDIANTFANGGELQSYYNNVESQEEMPEEQPSYNTTILPWDELSMSEKSDIMNRALERGITSLKDIRDSYNSGVLSQEAENTQEPEDTYNTDYYPDYSENYPNQGNIYASGGKMQGNSKAQRAMNFFMSKGLTKQQAAGIVGNLERESNLNPNAFNSAGGGHGAYGIAQWRGDRQTNLFRKYGSNPSFEDQLNYVWDELNSTHKRGLQKIRASKTADEAARNAFGYYEFSGGVDSAIADMNRHRAGNMSGIDALNRGIMDARSFYNGSSYDNTSDYSSLGSSLGNDDNSDIGITVPKVVIPKDFYDEKPQEEEKPKSYDAIAELRELMSTLDNKNYTSSALDALNPYYSTQEEGVPDIYYQSSPWDAIGRLKELMGNRVSDNSASSVPDNVFLQMMGNSHMFGPGGKVPKRMPDNFGIDLQKEMNSYGIQPTDNTYVGNTNVPVVVSKREAARLSKQNRRLSTGRKIANPQLERRAIEGAVHSREFDEEHPILAGLGYAMEAAPLAVAAYPFAAAAGELGARAAATTVGKTLLPWADAAVTSYFGADGINDVRNGEVTPETVLELAPMTRVGKGIIRAGKSISFPKKFTSELDWTPESWFGTRIKGTYDTDDVAALNAHIPEYHAIEKAAKRNGTWLKMPDSSTWEGDPRSWVQLQSKDGKKLMQKPFYHGERNYHKDINDNIITIDATPESLGENIIWTSSNKYLPYTYSDDHYVFSIPKNTRIVGIDAKGRNWNKLKDLNLGYEDTNDVAKDLLSNDNVVEIKNVIDMGDNARMWSEMNKLPKYLPNEKMYQYLNRVFKGDDYVLGKDVPRKSLLGNNGNFDFTKPNIYKSLIPIGIPFGIEYLSSNKK